jgi:imidazolonepropionase-like amidohydrolase
MEATTNRCYMFGLVMVVAAMLASRASLQQPTPQEAGTIVILHIERPIGQERYRVFRGVDGGSTLTSSLAYVDRGGKVELSSSLQAGPDFTPLRFEVQGKTYRFVNIDAAVDIHNGTAIVRNRGETSETGVSGPFWTARGLAPLAARGLLVRYWERHGRPRRVMSLPDGNSLTIQYRGIDAVRVRGRSVQLRRYAVEGVVWGQEAVWLDDQDRFAALLTRIHILPLEAVREDLQEALPQLQASARQDRMADLAALTERVVPVARGSFALAGARVIDGTGRPPIDDATIVVRDGRIIAVGPQTTVRIPSGVTVLPADGKTVIPGLWDMHGHLSQIEWGPAYLAAGVTSARDVGGEREFLTAFRDALASDRGLGPRLLLAGLVDADGSEAYGMTSATTPEQGRAVVEAYQRLGFLQVKLYNLLAPAVVMAVARRAHELGMTVTGHVPLALSVQQAIDAGMDQFEHLGPIRGEPDSAEVRGIVELLARRGTVVGPTPAWDELLGRAPTTAVSSFEPGILQTPAPLAASYHSVRNEIDAAQAAANAKRRLEIIKKLHGGGVKVVAGTDGAVPGHSLLRTLELFVEAGMTPIEAIASAASVPARFMKMDKEVGTIEQGKRADLVVLDADPLISIANVRKGRWVVANGRLYDCEELWRSAGFTPKR